MKKSLTAKEEVERSQIEAIHQLTERNKKLDNEVTQLKGQIDDGTQKYETTKKSLDAAKKELVDKNKATNELQSRQQMVQSLEKEKQNIELQNEEVMLKLIATKFNFNLILSFLVNQSIGRFENEVTSKRSRDVEERTKFTRRK